MTSLGLPKGRGVLLTISSSNTMQQETLLPKRVNPTLHIKFSMKQKKEIATILTKEK